MELHSGINWKTNHDHRGVLTVSLNIPDHSVNTFNREVMEELRELIDSLEPLCKSTDHDTTTTERVIEAIVFKSGKPSGFIAGADINQVESITSPTEAEAISQAGQILFHRISQLPVPTIAVIRGACLGGGLEFALACDFRLVFDDSSTRLGLPEVQLGILPAWGGTQRLPKQVGLQTALEMMLKGKDLSARQAKQAGLVDHCWSDKEFSEKETHFIDTLLKDSSSQKSRSTSGKSLKNWFLDSTGFGRQLILNRAQSGIQKRDAQYPALGNILEATRQGIVSGFEQGLTFERKALGKLLFDSRSRNLIRLFLLRNRARQSIQMVSDSSKIKHVGVIGAGPMGTGIAQWAAFNGFHVVLCDIDPNKLSAASVTIDHLFNKAVQHHFLTAQEADRRKSLIQTGVSSADFQPCELVIEAVSEKWEIKQTVLQQLNKQLKPDTLIASNTSSLSINQLAETIAQPERFAGLHFFNPPHLMKLIEVVQGSETSAETIDRLRCFSRDLGKIPILVQDSPGFLVNRVLFPYLAESIRLVVEGVNVKTIDTQMRRFGMPMGPLELLDSIGLDVAADISQTLSSFSTEATSTIELLQKMVQKGWVGKKQKRGFYYHETKKPTVNPAVSTLADSISKVQGAFSKHPVDENNIESRLVYLMINEAARCLGEEIVEEADMIDLALVYGTGFAPFTGGPLRLAADLGFHTVVSTLDALQDRHGERFQSCSVLRSLADPSIRVTDQDKDYPFDLIQSVQPSESRSF